MKRIALILAVALSSAACFAQVTKSEMKQLQSFLSQPSEKGETNAQALKITVITTPQNPATSRLSFPQKKNPTSAPRRGA